MQINLNPTSERGASRPDAVNRPRETLGDSHLISSDPRSRFGLVCDLLCCRGNTISARYDLSSALILPIMEIKERGFAVPGWGEWFFEGTGSRSMRVDA